MSQKKLQKPALRGMGIEALRLRLRNKKQLELEEKDQLAQRKLQEKIRLMAVGREEREIKRKEDWQRKSISLKNYRVLKKGDSLWWTEVQLGNTNGKLIRSYSVGNDHYRLYEWSDGDGGVLRIVFDDEGLESKLEQGLK